MILKDFLSTLSSCNVITVYDSDCNSKMLDAFIYRWRQAEHTEKDCLEKYGNKPVTSWYVNNNQIDVYVETNE